MTRLLTLIALLHGVHNLKAQLLKSFTIHFETNKYNLTSKHHYYIDSIISSLPNIPEAYIIEVKGHTDNKGALELNNSLSKNRALAVLNYLKNKKFNSTDTSMKFFAYNKPLKQNTEDYLWVNRRVEINLYARKLDMVKILGIKDFKPKTYKFIEDVGGNLNYDSTQIVIPANSFIHKNGTEVTGEIDISYIEYRNPSDFILSGIPMSIKDGNNLSHFNSGGMFDFAAYQNDEELILKKEKDKTIYITFPLSNFINQNFYQFDTTNNQWNNNAAAITNIHGNMLFPFNGGLQSEDSVTLRDRQNFNKCVPYNDTCNYIKHMIKKLNYYVNNEEPIRLNYPYKFTKNNLVDFKSPLYEIEVNENEHTMKFIPKNSHNKLGVFSNYIWKYKGDIHKQIKYSTYGCSYVKISNRTGLTFKLIIENEVISVTGEPINFKEENANKKTLFSLLYGSKDKAYLAKLKKHNKQNFKKYLKYTQELDKQEIALESTLLSKDEKYPGGTDKSYCEDSINCMGYFYRNYLYTLDEKEIIGIENFNLHKEKLAKKIKALPTPFTCNDATRLLIKKDSINKIICAKRDSSLNTAKRTFAKFGINSTGIYNADQVKNINEPIEILTNYKSHNGIPLKIISIYVSIKGLNGIINYNGYMDYGPYKFVYGKYDKTMLIAVDENEKSYYCSPDEFAKFVAAKQGKNVSFILKPISNIESSENLQKIVSSK